jgi:Cytochrome b5-like Heme/Steroid binding domain
VDDGVYDVSSFLDEHPGGKKILQRVLGKDASKQFWKYHNEKVMQKYAPRLKIGTIGSSAAATTAPPKPAPQATYSPPRPKIATKPVAEQSPSKPSSSNGKGASEIFGEVCSSSDILNGSLSHLQNLRGTLAWPLHITTTLISVFASSCEDIWKNISTLMSSSGKKPNSSQRIFSVRSPNRVLLRQPCFPSLQRSTWRELHSLQESRFPHALNRS